MTIRILADREPYLFFAGSRSASSSQDSPAFLNGPPGLDEAGPDVLVLPVEDFLSLGADRRRSRERRCVLLPYGPAASMGAAFACGCLDFLREPWTLPELEARALRLAPFSLQVGESSTVILRGRLLIGEIRSVELSENEMKLLRLLLSFSPLPVSGTIALREMLTNARSREQALSRLVASLKKKLNTCEPGLGDRIRGVRGLGYRYSI